MQEVFDEEAYVAITVVGHRPFELHQHVNIAVVAGFVPRDRAEERQRLHAEGRDFSTVLLDQRDDIGPSHALSLHTGASGPNLAAPGAWAVLADWKTGRTGRVSTRAVAQTVDD